MQWKATYWLRHRSLENMEHKLKYYPKTWNELNDKMIRKKDAVSLFCIIN